MSKSTKVAKNHSEAQFQKEGFNLIHDSFTNAKSIESLTKAVEKSIPIIQEYRLDEYQQKRLEDYGMHRFELIQRDIDRLAFEASRNKFKR